METRPGWLPVSEVLRQIADAGFDVSERQLERRREEGLLPPADQQQIYQGSIVRHHPITVEQAIAIERCLRVKDHFDFAGPLLWCAGYEVDDRYYAQRLDRADHLLRSFGPMLKPIMRKLNRQEKTFGDALGPLTGLTGLLAKINRRLDDETTPHFVNVVAELATRDFDGFGSPEAGTADLLTHAFDLRRGVNDQVMGANLDLGTGLEGVLLEISQSSHLHDFTPAEIKAARDDVRNALKIATCLHDAMNWIYDAGAFGVRLSAYFAQTMGTQSLLTLIMGFARLRKHNARLYSSIEIALMAQQMENTWLISMYFRDLSKDHRNLGRCVTPERIKIALSDPSECAKMVKELIAYPFLAPEFRSWNSWQKLAKKKMSPGLLVMSIGSPERLSFEEVVANASGAKNL